MSGSDAPATGPGRWALSIIWPAFLMAGVLEMLVFALVDPADLHWLGGTRIALSRQAIYSLMFFVFWLVICVAGALTALLITTPPAEAPKEALGKGRY